MYLSTAWLVFLIMFIFPLQPLRHSLITSLSRTGARFLWQLKLTAAQTTPGTLYNNCYPQPETSQTVSKSRTKLNIQ